MFELATDHLAAEGRGCKSPNAVNTTNSEHPAAGVVDALPFVGHKYMDVPELGFLGWPS